MKKLLWLVLLFGGVAHANGPIFQHKDTYEQQEFENAYQDIRSVSILTSSGTTRCIDIPTFCVDSINHQIIVGTSAITRPIFVISGSTGTGIGSVQANALSLIANNVEIARAQPTTFKIFQPISAGDGTPTLPFYGFDVDSNTGLYRVGNDILGFATGGTERFEVGNSSITANLEMQRPNQPSFLVTNSAGNTDVTGDGTAFTVTWGNEITDRASNFASNTFTAPVTGDYSLTANVFLRQLAVAHTSIILAIVTSNREYRATFLESALSFNSMPLHVAVADADMDANDTATVVVTVSGSTKVIDIDNDAKQNYFSGSLQN